MQVNFSYINEIAGGRKELLLNLFKAILESLKEFPAKMQAANAEGDYKKLGELAHKYKSSTNYVGNESFSLLLNEVELCRQEPNPNADDITIKIGLVTRESSAMKDQIQEKIREIESEQ